MKVVSLLIRPPYLLLILLLSLLVPAAHAADTQPNIVYILADDKN